MRSQLKNLVIERLNSWHILPSAEMRATMSPGEIQAFISAAVVKLRHEDGFLHFELDEDVSRLPPLMHSVRCSLKNHRVMWRGSIILFTSRSWKSLCTERMALLPCILTNFIRSVQSQAWH